MPFIRHGRWCECESSYNSAKAVIERGVSVYECTSGASGSWGPTGDAWQKNWPEKRQPEIERSPSAWFLVDGDVMPSRGFDGDPLLQVVRFVACLAWDPSASAFNEIEGDDPGAGAHEEHPCDSYKDIFESMYGGGLDEEDDAGPAEDDGGGREGGEGPR